MLGKLSSLPLNVVNSINLLILGNVVTIIIVNLLNTLNDNSSVIAWMLRDIHEEVEPDPVSPGLSDNTPDGLGTGVGCVSSCSSPV